MTKNIFFGIGGYGYTIKTPNDAINNPKKDVAYNPNLCVEYSKKYNKTV